MELKEAINRAETWTQDMSSVEKEGTLFGVLELLLSRIKSLEMRHESLSEYIKKLKSENEALSLDLGLKDKCCSPVVKDNEDKSSW